MDQKAQVPAGSKKGAAMTVLSQTLLYAPLSAYDSSSGTLPSPTTKKKKVAKAHSESAFVTWLQHASVDFHRRAEVRNTGNRSLSTQEIQDKVLHRGLSLSKQYMMKPKAISMTTTPAEAAANNGTTSAQRRKRKKQSSSAKNGVVIRMTKENGHADQSEFLQRLNVLWTQYMSQLLLTLQQNQQKPLTSRESDDNGNNNIPTENMSLSSASDDNRFDTIIKSSLYKVVDKVDWVGARVCIEDCKAFTSWEQRQGIIVSTTTNTWTIVEQAETSKQQQPDEEQQQFFRMKIPKKGSCLIVLLDLNNNGTAIARSNDSIFRIRLNGDALVEFL